MLVQKVRSLSITVKALEQSLIDEEKKNHECELRLRKLQNELENAKNKYEQSVQENHAELLEER